MARSFSARTATVSALIGVIATALAGVQQFWVPGQFTVPILTMLGGIALTCITPLAIIVAVAALLHERAWITACHALLIVIFGVPASIFGYLFLLSWGSGFDAEDTGRPLTDFENLWLVFAGLATIFWIAFAVTTLVGLVGRRARAAVSAAPQTSQTSQTSNQKPDAPARASRALTLTLAGLALLLGIAGLAVAFTADQWAGSTLDGTEAVGWGIRILLFSTLPLIVLWGSMRVRRHPQRASAEWMLTATLGLTIVLLTAAYFTGPEWNAMAPWFAASSLVGGFFVAYWMSSALRMAPQVARLIGISAGLLYAAYFGSMLLIPASFLAPVAAVVLVLRSIRRHK